MIAEALEAYRGMVATLAADKPVHRREIERILAAAGMSAADLFSDLMRARAKRTATLEGKHRGFEIGN